MSDASQIGDLIAKTALKDRAAFAELYERTSAKLFGVALRILKDRGEAEDALQEIYIRIWRRAGSYRPQQYSPMSWLIAIARNHAIDRIRARKAATVDVDEVAGLEADGMDPEKAAVLASEVRRIDACMEELKAERADAVRSAYMDGYSYEELAERHKVPLNTMRTWLRRSLMKLRACLEK